MSMFTAEVLVLSIDSVLVLSIDSNKLSWNHGWHEDQG